jgi:ketosteroid isomerase-like protein
MKLGIDAYNRRDYEAAVLCYDPDVEYITPVQVIPLGFDSTYRGRQARMDLQRKWIAEWGEFLFKPEELIDVGDGRLLVTGRMEGSGLSSGVVLDNDWAVLFTISAGQVTREQVFLDQTEALEAAGLSE